MTRRKYLALALTAQGCRIGENSSSTVRLTTILGSPSPFIMQSLGLFEKERVVVRVEQVASTGKIVQAIVGGSADVAYTGLDHVIHLAAQAKPAKMFFTASPLINSRFYVASGSKRSIAG